MATVDIEIVETKTVILTMTPKEAVWLKKIVGQESGFSDAAVSIYAALDERKLD